MHKENKEIYKLDLEPLVFTDRAIDINTKKGKLAATRMAHRINEGKERIENVPKSYRNYVEGALYGSIPTTKAIDKAGKQLAPVLAASFAAPYIIGGGAIALSNPIVRSILNTVGTIDGIRNAASKNGVRKTIRLAKERDYLGAVKSGIGDVLDITGGIGFADDIYRYGKGTAKRLAEAVLRIGDGAHAPTLLKEQLLNKNAINYILNPFADSNLAYKLPYRYSGNEVGIDGAHKGDIIDQYLRKVPVSSNLDKNTIPEGLKKYIQNNYKNRDIKYIDLGNLAEPYSGVNFSQAYNNDVLNLLDGQHIIKGGEASVLYKGHGENVVPVLDPGGYNAKFIRQGNDLVEEGYDIWKFNDADYMKRHPYTRFSKYDIKNRLVRKGLRFLDSQGEPIVHKFTSRIKNFYK